VRFILRGLKPLLYRRAEQRARQERLTLNQWFTQAIAEKIAAADSPRQPKQQPALEEPARGIPDEIARQIEAAQVVDTLGTIVPKPQNEAQARVLASEAWLCETAQAIQEKVREARASREPQHSGFPPETDDADSPQEPKQKAAVTVLPVGVKYIR
jgi:hypothetical protein